ncbi:MAG: enoyl-CoA hydratase/isomerase family protein [Thermodesulfobacteriota bacterium]
MESQATDVVLSQDHGPVRVLTLNRPERLNVLDETLKDAMMAALAAAKADQSVAALVITGSGRAFSAGADLARFEAMAQNNDWAARERFTDLAFPRAFTSFPKPLIAAINGVCVGWGATMPLICDLRLASRAASFAFGFVRVGVTPEFGSAYFLSRLIGLGRAMELVLTARQFGAEEALAMGLVNRVVEPDELLPAALELASALAAFPRPAIAMAKSVMQLGAQSPLEQTMLHEIELFKTAMATDEHRRAVAAMRQAIAAKTKA